MVLAFVVPGAKKAPPPIPHPENLLFFLFTRININIDKKKKKSTTCKYTITNWKGRKIK